MNLLCFGNMGNRVALVRVTHSIQSEKIGKIQTIQRVVLADNSIMSLPLCYATTLLVSYFSRLNKVQ